MLVASRNSAKTSIAHLPKEVAIINRKWAQRQETREIRQPPQSVNVIQENVEHLNILEDFDRMYLVDKGKKSEKTLQQRVLWRYKLFKLRHNFVPIGPTHTLPCLQ